MPQPRPQSCACPNRSSPGDRLPGADRRTRSMPGLAPSWRSPARAAPASRRWPRGRGSGAAPATPMPRPWLRAHPPRRPLTPTRRSSIGSRCRPPSPRCSRRKANRRGPLAALHLMRFALLGDHPDGLDVTRALVESGRYELAVYAGPPAGGKQLARWGLAPPRQGDLEEVLADPAIDAVIVATPLANRAAVLRRALQSERHVLCVHPADRTADIAFEAALLQRDTGCVLLPLLPEAVPPAVARFEGDVG